MKIGVLSRDFRAFCIKFAPMFHGHTLVHITSPDQLKPYRRELGCVATWSLGQAESEQIWLIEDPATLLLERQLTNLLISDGWFINMIGDIPGGLNSMRHLAFTMNHLNPEAVLEAETMRQHLNEGCLPYIHHAMVLLQTMACLKAVGYHSWDDLVKHVQSAISTYLKQEGDPNDEKSVEDIVQEFMTAIGVNNGNR